MGVHPNIGYEKYPQQGWKDKRARVCFKYDLLHVIMGTIVRDDDEDPYVTIIKLDDGRYVLGTECQYSPE